MNKAGLVSGVLALAAAAAPGLGAHDLVSLNGQGFDHQHVEQAGRYGCSTPRQGHYAKPPGSKNGILIYSARQPSSYGNLVPVEGLDQPPVQEGTLHQQFEAGMARHRLGPKDKE